MEQDYYGSKYRARARRERRNSGRRGQTRKLGPREVRRLVQLFVCIAVFLVVFIGNGVFPQQMLTVRSRLTAIMEGDTDFRAAFSALGASVAEGEPTLEALGNLWVDVLGEERGAPNLPTRDASSASPAQKLLMTRPTTVEEMLFRSPDLLLPPRPTPAPPVTQAPESSEPAVVHVDYLGPALPANATMDRYPLGLAATVSPVVAPISSGFGWRAHPLDGQEKFHNGVDLVVNEGSAVRAFADGVVDYVGESPVYGLYMQLRHANGVTTFYAHNSKLCRQQGERVAMGEKITQSGQTGNVTGAHLHFEVKKDGLLLNPAYYIKTQ